MSNRVKIQEYPVRLSKQLSREKISPTRALDLEERYTQKKRFYKAK